MATKKVPRGLVGSLIEVLLDTKSKQATKFLSDRLVVKATRKTYRRDGDRIANDYDGTTIVFKIGRPNYEERKFIKLCKQAGEPFPVKKIQLKDVPKRRKPIKKLKKGKKR